MQIFASDSRYLYKTGIGALNKMLLLDSVASLYNWIPSIISSLLSTSIIAAVGIYYKSKTEKLIEHNFNVKIEKIKSTIRADEEQFKADLRARDDQLASLKSAALSGMSSRRASIHERKIRAIETVWASAISQPQLKILVTMIKPLKVSSLIERASSQSSDSERIKEFFESIWRVFSIDSMPSYTGPEKERPFISSKTWALYQAYRQMAVYPMAQVAAGKMGFGNSMLSSLEENIDILKLVLPHHSDLITEKGIDIIPYLIEKLEEKLLIQLQSDLEDTAEDQKAVEEAAIILKAVERASTSMKSSSLSITELK